MYPNITGYNGSIWWKECNAELPCRDKGNKVTNQKVNQCPCHVYVFFLYSVKNSKEMKSKFR